MKNSQTIRMDPDMTIIDGMPASVRRLLDAASCPGGELAGELLQKMQRLDDFK